MDGQRNALHPERTLLHKLSKDLNELNENLWTAAIEAKYCSFLSTHHGTKKYRDQPLISLTTVYHHRHLTLYFSYSLLDEQGLSHLRRVQQEPYPEEFSLTDVCGNTLGSDTLGKIRSFVLAGQA